MNLSTPVVSVSNLFNTHAVSGRGPFPPAELKRRIVVDLLFSSALEVPATSILCNPSWLHLLQHDAEFVDYILTKRKVVPLVGDDCRSLRELLTLLRDEPEAVALREDLAGATENNAAYLDDRLGPEGGVPVDQAGLEEEKRESAKRLLRSLAGVFPETASKRQEIEDYRKQEVQSRGKFDGTSFTRLPTAIPELRPLQHNFTELGVALFDFSYAGLRDSMLVGHPYGQGVRALHSLASETLPGLQILLDPGICGWEGRPIELGDWGLLAEVDTPTLGAVYEEISTAKGAYLASVGNIRYSSSPNDALMEAQASLDDLLLRLSTVMISDVLGRFRAEWMRRKRWERVLKPAVRVCQIGKNIPIISLVLYVAGKLDQPFVPSLIERWMFSALEKTSSSKLERGIETVESVRPYSMELRVK